MENRYKENMTKTNELVSVKVQFVCLFWIISLLSLTFIFLCIPILIYLILEWDQVQKEGLLFETVFGILASSFICIGSIIILIIALLHFLKLIFSSESKTSNLKKITTLLFLSLGLSPLLSKEFQQEWKETELFKSYNFVSLIGVSFLYSTILWIIIIFITENSVAKPHPHISLSIYTFLFLINLIIMFIGTFRNYKQRKKTEEPPLPSLKETIQKIVYFVFTVFIIILLYFLFFFRVLFTK